MTTDPTEPAGPPHGYSVISLALIFKSRGPWAYVRPNGDIDVGTYLTREEAIKGAELDHYIRTRPHR